MNIFIDPLPTTIEVRGQQYDIDPDFRNFIFFSRTMKRDDLLPIEKAYVVLYKIVGDLTVDPNNALEQIYGIYVGPTSEDIEVGVEEESDGAIEKPVLDFDYDSGLIHSAFMTQYNIDLRRVQFLHWWEFKELFNGLEEDRKIVQVMQIRSMKIDSDMSKEQKKQIRELKRIYELPDPRPEEVIEQEFHNVLGGMF